MYLATLIEFDIDTHLNHQNAWEAHFIAPTGPCCCWDYGYLILRVLGNKQRSNYTNIQYVVKALLV